MGTDASICAFVASMDVLMLGFPIAEFLGTVATVINGTVGLGHDWRHLQVSYFTLNTN